MVGLTSTEYCTHHGSVPSRFQTLYPRSGASRPPFRWSRRVPFDRLPQPDRLVVVGAVAASKTRQVHTLIDAALHVCVTCATRVRRLYVLRPAFWNGKAVAVRSWTSPPGLKTPVTDHGHRQRNSAVRVAVRPSRQQQRRIQINTKNSESHATLRCSIFIYFFFSSRAFTVGAAVVWLC